VKLTCRATFGPSYTACLKRTARRICWASHVGAVIQSGRKNNAGTVVLTLKPPVGGASADCVPISDELAGKLVKDADKYWFTIQSAEYPDGAAGAWLQGMNG